MNYLTKTVKNILINTSKIFLLSVIVKSHNHIITISTEFNISLDERLTFTFEWSLDKYVHDQHVRCGETTGEEDLKVSSIISDS